jgi:hypothetical protein
MSGVPWALVLLVIAGYAVLIALALRFEDLSNSAQDLSPAGEDLPKVSVVVACKGQDIHLRDNLISILARWWCCSNGSRRDLVGA